MFDLHSSSVSWMIFDGDKQESSVCIDRIDNEFQESMAVMGDR